MKPTTFFFAAALVMSFGAPAQTTSASGLSQADRPPTSVTAPQTDGEVRKIDQAQGKVTLRHGPIENLGMPPMVMVFRVIDPRLLEGLKEGDKVKFSAEKINGAFTVTAIQAVK